MKKEEYQDMINDCHDRESQLSKWESDFLDSLDDQLGDGKNLSIKQIDKLTNIWERVTARG